METMLFVISVLITINSVISLFGAIVGNGINVPMPILHIWEVSYKNTYVSAFGLGYQIYFWATYYNIIDKF